MGKDRVGKFKSEQTEKGAKDDSGCVCFLFFLAYILRVRGTSFEKRLERRICFSAGLAEVNGLSNYLSD